MQVRQYKIGDEKSIALVHNMAFEPIISSLPEIYRYKMIEPADVNDWLTPEANALWVAETNERLIGYAHARLHIETGKQEIPVLQFMPIRDWDLSQANIAVLPEYQRKGVGTLLVREMLRDYSRKAKFAIALVFSDNAPGEKMFQSSGFTMHDVFYDTSFSDEYPLTNSSVYETLKLDSLIPPDNLNTHVMFRRARLRDAPIITEIHQANVWWCDECGTLEWNMQFIKGKLGHTVFVGELNGEVVGEMDYYKDGRVGIAGVLPEFRNQGIGSAMFYGVLRAMQKACFSYAFVDSGLTQTEAIKMYKRFGFSIQRRQNAWIRRLG
jgi:ribosomal protein S18 acetylase RimI-like enzyme